MTPPTDAIHTATKNRSVPDKTEAPSGMVNAERSSLKNQDEGF